MNSWDMLEQDAVRSLDERDRSNKRIQMLLTPPKSGLHGCRKDKGFGIVTEWTR